MKIPQNTVFNNVTIIDIAEEGKGIGKIDNWVVFVEQAVPGDVVDVVITYQKKKFLQAKIVSFLTKSPFRAAPFCEYFGTCGGCKWQHLSYDAQLHFKQKMVEDVMERVGGVSLKNFIKPILSSCKTNYYRNKLEFTFSDKRWLDRDDLLNAEQLNLNAVGFHVPQRFDKVLDIQQCYLQAEPSNRIRNALRDFAMSHQISFYNLRQHEGVLRNLIIRTSSLSQSMVIVVFAYPSIEQIHLVMGYLQNSFPEITSLLYVVNQKKNDTIFDQDVIVYSGESHISEVMKTPQGKNLTFKISPKSFYQTNSEQAERLYHVVWQLANFKGDELVYDLYTGTGTIANYIADSVAKVVGIEYVESAIADAKINATVNDIENTHFYAGDMKQMLNAAFVQQHGKPDVVVTDPPRAGMHADVLTQLLQILPAKIIYVSCNPATQARDVALLSEKYELVAVQPVDMFPHTQHVENVILLALKGGDS